MSNRILVVEASPREFEQWTNPEYGVGAQLEALGEDGSKVVIERIGTAADLFEVASEVKNGEHLPARALVLAGVYGSDLARNPIDAFWLRDMIEGPADYDEEHDPIWVHRGDENRSLSPYGRLIGSRLAQRALPEVRFWPFDEEYENYDNLTDLFHWEYAGMGYDELRPTYGGFLARVNKHLALTGQDFMSLVDTVGNKPYDRSEVIEGADIDLRFVIGVEPLVDATAEARSRVEYRLVRQIGVVAKLLKGDYPDATPVFEDLSSVLPHKEPLPAND